MWTFDILNWWKFKENGEKIGMSYIAKNLGYLVSLKSPYNINRVISVG